MESITTDGLHVAYCPENGRLILSEYDTGQSVVLVPTQLDKLVDFIAKHRPAVPPLTSQVPWATGRWDAICTTCRAKTTARVSGCKRDRLGQYREVRATCRHCGDMESTIIRNR